MDKSQLRRIHIERRLALTEAVRASLSATICGHLATWIEAAGVSRVGLYLPIRGEPDLGGLARLTKARLALPVVDASGRGMKFHDWQPGVTALAANRYGILEPQGTVEVQLGAADLLCVPSVALDKTGVRLGYGGGYYDVFLTTAVTPAIGVVFSTNFVGELPVAPHDRRLARIVTENGILST